LRGDIRELNAAAYWAQRFSISKGLDVTGALRADYFTNRYNNKLAAQVSTSNSTIVSPKLNFNYRINNNGELYLYNGRGFHSNDTRESVNKMTEKFYHQRMERIWVAFLR